MPEESTSVLDRPVAERSRLVAGGVAFLAVYIVCAKLGLRLAFTFPSATPIWPATGLAFVALLLTRGRLWPAVFVGAFIVNLTTRGTPLTSLGIATGNTLEALFGAWLIERFAGGRNCLKSAKGIFRFTLLAGFLSTMFSATIGTATLYLAGLAERNDLMSLWSTWWLGNASGDLVIAPVLLAWVERRYLPDWRSLLETLVLFVVLFLVAFALFGGFSGLTFDGSSLEFLCIPFLIWAAVRLGPRRAALAILLLGAIAVWGTIHGHGSFVHDTPNTSLLLLQAYMAVASVMTMMLAAAVAQRRSAEERLHALSISDALTGIANYRFLMTRLEAEIERSGRSGRPFAILFLDVDGLKQINDSHGHLVGSRALVRVGDALRASARVIDTAARYGGDEFALLLPETTAEEARAVADRVAERLAAGSETPVVTVSVGVAVHPADGATPEALIGAADERLYSTRSRPRVTQ